VISTVDVNNQASMRVLEKIGMRWEAVYRKHRRAKNRWWDCHLYTLPRSVWEASHPSGLLAAADQRRSCSILRRAPPRRARACAWPARAVLAGIGLPAERLVSSVTRPPTSTATTRPMMRTL
jgi:hypothetical protein